MFVVEFHRRLPGARERELGAQEGLIALFLIFEQGFVSVRSAANLRGLGDKMFAQACAEVTRRLVRTEVQALAITHAVVARNVKGSRDVGQDLPRGCGEVAMFPTSGIGDRSSSV